MGAMFNQHIGSKASVNTHKKVANINETAGQFGVSAKDCACKWSGYGPGTSLNLER